MHLILFDNISPNAIYPFSSTRPVAHLRIGIRTISEKWADALKIEPRVLSAGYITPQQINLSGEAIVINATIIPDEEFVDHAKRLSVSEALISNNMVLAGNMEWNPDLTRNDITPKSFKKHIPYNIPFTELKHAWQIFQNNEKALRFDFKSITTNRNSKPLSPTNFVRNPSNIFMEEGAMVEHAYLNANAGPIYIGKNAEIMEGAMIRGPFAVGESGIVKMGSRIYGATTIGPYSVAGGEIKNSVIMAYSNKGHEGYLGDSVIGEWCNIGAGTSNSNLKNTGSQINAGGGRGTLLGSPGIKCGLIMGDYTRCAINSSFNTATIVGIGSNIFGTGFAPNFIPDFTWGFTGKYEFEKALEHIANWKKLKNHSLSSSEVKILEHLYKQSD
ncbi:MAG: glucose-1-phosphate thymidylyltransferase [Bacteroidetes bacterium]|nr:MAG: glucose-1-phosphate thymidylyltransferase [Bacteroidota bacterium]